MATRRPLLWQLYPSYLLMVLFSLLAISWYASSSIKSFYMDHTRKELETRAYLIQNMLEEKLLQHESYDINAACKRFGSIATTRLTVILPDGKVIGDSEEEPERMDNHANRPEIIQAFKGLAGTSTRFSATLQKDMLYVALPVTKNGEVIGVLRASMPSADIDQALRTILKRIAIGGVIIALLSALVSLWVSKRIGRPILDVRAGAERFAMGDLSYRLQISGSLEIGALANTMNLMAEQLEERFRMITEQRNELEVMLASMIEAILVIDLQGNILRFNEAAANMLGVTPLKANSRPIWEITDNREIHQFVRSALDSDSFVEGEIVLDDGSERYLQMHGTTIRNATHQRTGALIVLHDVTRMKQLENVRKDFAANVSHELKTPITSIKGFVETLREGAIDEPDKAKRFLEIISRHSDRLNAIIEDLLALARIEQNAEASRIQLESGPLKDVIVNSMVLCSPKAQAKQIDLQVDCSDDLVAMINPQLLEQALVNLVDNAIKYSEEQGHIRIACTQEPGGVCIQVIDSGFGIPQETLARIFERFYRVDKARSRKMGGTGLGLAIVKHIVSAHNGSIEVQSELGKGSTFTIHLLTELPESAQS